MNGTQTNICGLLSQSQLGALDIQTWVDGHHDHFRFHIWCEIYSLSPTRLVLPNRNLYFHSLLKIHKFKKKDSVSSFFFIAQSQWSLKACWFFLRSWFTYSSLSSKYYSFHKDWDNTIPYVWDCSLNLQRGLSVWAPLPVIYFEILNQTSVS